MFAKTIELFFEEYVVSSDPLGDELKLFTVIFFEYVEDRVQFPSAGTLNFGKYL